MGPLTNSMTKLTLEEMKAIALPKWPGHLVVGDRITPQQAQELLIRTDTLFLSGNHPESELPYFKALYPKLPDVEVGSGRQSVNIASYYSNPKEAYKYQEEVLKELGNLNLEYLTNDRIISSNVRGPNGWCSVDGAIFQNTGNIGKWPSVDAVYREWVTIAKTFPYLSLRSQLLNKEYCNEDAVPVVEYYVHNGEVDCYLPAAKLVENNVEDDIAWAFLSRREIGVSLSWFQQGLDRLRQKTF